MNYPTMDKIFFLLEERFGVKKADLLSSNKSQPITNCRRFAMYLAREILGLSYPMIGKVFRKNHSTAVHACQKMEEQLKIPEVKKQVDALLEELKLYGLEPVSSPLELRYSIYRLDFEDGSSYVGCSSSPHRRLTSHKSQGIAGRNVRDCKMTIIEEGLILTQALKREKEEQLKLEKPLNVIN